MRRLLVLLLVLLSASPALAGNGFSTASPLYDQSFTSDQGQTLVGRGWSTGGNFTIPANNVLNIYLTNPLASNCPAAVFTFRRYTNTSGSQLSYTSYKNPTFPASGGTTVTVGNRDYGSTLSVGLQMNATTSGTAISTGTAGVVGPLLATAEQDIFVPLVLRRGNTFGLTFTGLSGLLATAATVGVTITGFCNTQ